MPVTWKVIHQLRLHHKFKLLIGRGFPHPFIFHCLEGTIKWATVSTELWNQGVSALNLHPTLKKHGFTIMLQKEKTEGRRHSDIYESHNWLTFTSSDGHNTKLIIAPPYAADGIITWGRGTSLWPPPFTSKKEVINNHMIDSNLNKTSKDIYAQKGSSN
jgi:hypothetical protein